MRNFKITSLCLAFFLLLISSEWKDEIKEIRKKYAEANSIELDMLVSLKDAKGKTYESFTSKVVKDGQEIYYKGIDYEAIVNSTEKVMVMKEEKAIYVFPGMPDELETDHDRWLTVLDSFHYYTEKEIEYKKGEDGWRQIAFTPVKSRFDKMEIEYSVSDGQVKKVRMFPKQAIEDKKGNDVEKPFVEIYYKKQKFNGKIPVSLFSTNKYVIKKGENYELTEGYKHYTLYIHPPKSQLK